MATKRYEVVRTKPGDRNMDVKTMQESKERFEKMREHIKALCGWRIDGLGLVGFHKLQDELSDLCARDPVFRGMLFSRWLLLERLVDDDEPEGGDELDGDDDWPDDNMSPTLPSSTEEAVLAIRRLEREHRGLMKQLRRYRRHPLRQETVMRMNGELEAIEQSLARVRQYRAQTSW